MRCQFVKGIKVADFICLLNFEWYNQNKVCNVLVFLHCREIAKNSIERLKKHPR